MCKDSPQNLVTKGLLQHENAVSHFLFHQGLFYFKQHDLLPPHNLLTWFVPLWLFSVSLIDDTTILIQLRWLRQNHRRYWTHSQNMTSRMHLKMAEVLGTVHMRGRELPQGWWWPVGSKLVSDQMAAPVLEILDRSTGNKSNEGKVGTLGLSGQTQWWEKSRQAKNILVPFSCPLSLQAWLSYHPHPSLCSIYLKNYNTYVGWKHVWTL
jgi:hypothetical protein